MKWLSLCFCISIPFVFAGHLKVVPAENLQISVEQIQPIELNEELECINTGISTTPPWQLYRDPPWSTGIQIPDVYNRSDSMLSMAVGPDGRIYVAYTAIWNASPARGGFGLASSTDAGLTWDNRVFYYNNTAFGEFDPEITVTNDGKIWLWGTLNGGTYVNTPCWLRSSATCYNNPDSLRGFLLFNIPYRFYGECVSWGNGNELVFMQYTVDRTGSNDSVFCVFSYDSTNWWVFTFRPPGGNPGMTSIGLDVSGTDTILVHGIEYFDATGNDWDVVFYLDTLNGSGNFYGWATANTLNDRYPSVYCTQGYAYIAIQSDVGSGNNDILFNYSTDYGATWNGALIDITNDAINETYPRLHGFSTTIGCNYIYDANTVRHNYSVWNGQDGTWQPTPEIVTDNVSARSSYHATALLWTPAYFHSVWEDTRNQGTDGIEIYASRRTAPIGVSESNVHRFGKLRLYPNPFKDKVTIGLSGGFVGKTLALSVYDLTGKLIANNSFVANNSSIVWNATDNYGRKLPAGIYVLRIDDGNRIVTQKAVMLE
ncbi:MAG: T9SS type A sorting domain-containing protein [candidate division WOR-3 bacterium]